MEKVKVTKEQAEALALFKRGGNTNEQSIHEFVMCSEGWKDTFVPVREMGLDALIKALYIGYEVELTPEEKLLEYYNLTTKNIKKYHDKSIVANLNGQLYAIERISEILDIKIEGVDK